METLDTTACYMMDEEELLNFHLDDDDDDGDDKTTVKPLVSSLEYSNPLSQDPDHHNRSFPEFAEEELEWLSNKDAFPAVETCLDILSGNPSIALNHLSPVSVLENITNSNNGTSSTIMSCCGSFQVPVRARSKRRRKRRRGFPDLPPQQYRWWDQINMKQESPTLSPRTRSTSIGRRCQHCRAEKTPQWRAGPMGPKTLCNACGVRYKSGRLVPEYRPANSPTFSTLLHSNSHRKVMEMRSQKQMGMGASCGYRVG